MDTSTLFLIMIILICNLPLNPCSLTLHLPDRFLKQTTPSFYHSYCHLREQLLPLPEPTPAPESPLPEPTPVPEPEPVSPPEPAPVPSLEPEPEPAPASSPELAPEPPPSPLSPPEPEPAPSSPPEQAPVSPPEPEQAPYSPPEQAPVLPPEPEQAPVSPPELAPVLPPEPEQAPVSPPELAPVLPPEPEQAPVSPPEPAPLSPPAPTPASSPELAPPSPFSPPEPEPAPLLPPEQAPVSPPEPEQAPYSPPEQAPVLPPEPEKAPVSPPEQAPPVSPPEQAPVLPPEPEQAPVLPPEPEQAPVSPPELAPVLPPEPEQAPVSPPELAPVLPPEPEQAPVSPPEPAPVSPPEPTPASSPELAPPSPLSPPEPEPAPLSPPEQAPVSPPEPEQAPVSPPELAPETPPEPEPTPISPPEPEPAPISPPEPEPTPVSPPEPEPEPAPVSPPEPEPEPLTEYIEVTTPLPANPTSPSCSVLLLQHDFSNTYGKPPISTLYSPPSDCSAPWSQIILEFHASCKGEQYDRIAGVWLSGIEILRTSTAEPTDSGVFWTVRKDITRYHSLLLQSDLTLSVMLENLVDETFTGIYHVQIFVHFYQKEEEPKRKPMNIRNNIIRWFQSAIGEILETKSRVLSEQESGSQRRSKLASGSLYEDPADMIIPVSAGDGSVDGFWFRIQNESDTGSKIIEIPVNTYRAVLEIYLSFHSDDEFWYSNPPNSYIKKNNLTTGRGNGAFRQVFALVDGLFVGSVLPFPVIFTGGINPLFWEPVVAIGAFDLPSYDLDLTPFLGLLLDGKPHSFSIGVTDSLPVWLVDANLHLWLDHGSCTLVTGKLFQYQAPRLSLSRDYDFEKLDGKFKIKGKRKIRFSGWVDSSLGNLTTHVYYKLKYKNKMKFKNNGSVKEVKQKIKVESEVEVLKDSKKKLLSSVSKKSYPLEMTTSNLGNANGTYKSTTTLSHAMDEKSTTVLPSGRSFTSLVNNQDSQGWMLVEDHSVLCGSASTKQVYTYKDNNGCYYRNLAAKDGEFIADNSTTACRRFVWPLRIAYF